MKLTENEILGLFILLRDQELALDPTLTGLLDRLRERLYTQLSIDELENVERRYRSQGGGP